MSILRFLSMLMLLPIFAAAQGPVQKQPVDTYFTTFIPLDNFNGKEVLNNPVNPTTFTIEQPSFITSIQTFHWNNRRGSTLGAIKLIHSNGTEYGPWEASGIPGDGGVPNAYWTVTPDVILPAGTYTIFDTDYETWSQNKLSQNRGFAKVFAKRK